MLKNFTFPGLSRHKGSSTILFRRLCLTLLILLESITGSPAFAQDDFTVGNIHYTTIEGTQTCEVSHASPESGEVVIPETVEYSGKSYTVVKIGKMACRSSGLTSLYIPNSVTEIGMEAFWECKGLTSLYIPNSVTAIGSNAFYYCSGLTSVIIGNSVTSIGKSAFDGCFELKKAAYPNNIDNPFPAVQFGNVVMSYNPDGATIEDGWIWGPGKTEIRFAPYYLEGEYAIPETVTSIGDHAFSCCSGLTSVEIPNSVTEIGSNAFYYCSGLTSVKIPDSVTEIGSDAFYNCSGLTSVKIPNSVISIGNYAFYYCI